VYLMEYHAEYGITPRRIMPGYAENDTVHVEGPLRFDQIAALTDMSVEQVTILNPMFRKKIVPGPGEVWALTIPKTKIPLFLVMEDSMKTINPDLTPVIKYAPEAIYYKVKSGDVLGIIAETHGVSVKHLQEWNALTGTTIRIGQRLIIHGDPSKL
jgi:membrane-bound lytic murein transglycosylase D